MAFDVTTGVYTQSQSVLPLNAELSPATGNMTPVTPVAAGPGDAGPLTGGVMPTTAMNLEQQRQGEADCRDAQLTAMNAREDQHAHYQGQALPLGGQIGNGMTLPPSPLDPGVGSLGSGEASPFGSFYDPPRPGATETSTAAGMTYMGNTGNEP